MGGLHWLKSKDTHAPNPSSSPALFTKYGFFWFQNLKMATSFKPNSWLHKNVTFTGFCVLSVWCDLCNMNWHLIEVKRKLKNRPGAVQLGHSSDVLQHSQRKCSYSREEEYVCCKVLALRRCFLWKLWVLQPAVARQPHKEMSISGLMDGIFSAMKLQLFISLILSVILFIPGEVFS